LRLKVRLIITEDTNKRPAIDQTSRMLIVHACMWCVIAHADMVVSKNYEGVVELFSDDAGSDVGGIRSEGKDATRTGIVKRRNDRVSRHVLTSILISIESADAASGITDLTLFRTYDEAREPIQGGIQPAMAERDCIALGTKMPSKISACPLSCGPF
jgi:hypothetical protein